MKILEISRGKVPLAEIPLIQPMMIVGRSPTCDVILRAPGVKPVHFLLEWVGAGQFDVDSGEGSWSIFDISPSEDLKTDLSEGIVVGFDKRSFAGFEFVIRHDKLSSLNKLGGLIKKSIESVPREIHKGTQHFRAEIVQIKADSGAVEQVVHLDKNLSRNSITDRIPQFKIRWDGGLHLLLGELNGAEIYIRGQKIHEKNSFLVKPNDLYLVRWRGRDFYIRMVPEISVPPLRRSLHEYFHQALILTATSIAVIGIFLIGAELSLSREAKVVEPPRVATVKIVEELSSPPPPLPPPPPPPPLTQEVVEQVAKNPPQEIPQKVTEKSAMASANQMPAQAAQARRPSPETSKNTTGLNSPAPKKDVNAIGLLGALGGGGPQKIVRAENVFNGGVITDSVSNQADSVPVLVKNPPAGTIDPRAQDIDSGGQGSPGLGGASTTLSGSKDFNVKSVGPIGTGEGGSEKWAAGTNQLGQGTIGGSQPGKGLGEMGAEDFDVSGGLDRETVRRIVRSYQKAMAACYNRRLLVEPKLRGKITYEWHIQPDGPVAWVKPRSNTTESNHLQDCVQDVIKSMVFPAAENKQPTRVIYPFTFNR